MNQSAKINIMMTFKNMDSSDAVRDYAEKRVAKIEKHVHTTSTAQYVFHIEKTEHVAHLNLKAGDFDCTAEGRAETMYAAIDTVVDKILHQTRKHKEQQTSHHKGTGHHNAGTGASNIIDE